MSNLRLPALDPLTVDERRGSGYPEPFRSRMGDRVKRRLGDACGLTRFGVNLVTLGPGGQSALRQQLLHAGQCAGYPAGSGDAHHFINRSGKPARYLEIGNRDDADTAYYPDDDLKFADTGDTYVHKDGRPYRSDPGS